MSDLEQWRLDKARHDAEEEMRDEIEEGEDE